MADLQASTERTEIEPLLIGGYVKAMTDITYANPTLIIPKNTHGIVKERASEHEYYVVWPQDFEHPRLTHENLIARV